MASTRSAHWQAILYNLVIFAVGIAVFASNGLDGKLIGTGVMLYSALGHAIDAFAAEAFDALSEMDGRLKKIETLLANRSN
jgi:hypothetical protein